MIQELIERVHQYYTGFTNLPMEGQVIVGIGLVVTLAALKNIWGILYPVRWTAASLLRIAAFFMHPRRRRPKVDAANDQQVIPSFDVSTLELFNATLRQYQGSDARNLSDSQIDLLIRVADVYNINTDRNSNSLGYLGSVITERDRRVQETEVQRQIQGPSNNSITYNVTTAPVAIEENVA